MGCQNNGCYNFADDIKDWQLAVRFCLPVINCVPRQRASTCWSWMNDPRHRATFCLRFNESYKNIADVGITSPARDPRLGGHLGSKF